MSNNIGSSYKALYGQKTNKFPFLIGLLLLIAPLTRGMYFDLEFYFGTIFLGLVFLGFMAKQRLEQQQMLGVDAIGIAGWGMLAAYVLSLTVAVNMDSAVGQVIRWGAYLLLYYLVAYSANRKRDVEFYLGLIYVAAIIVAVAGLGTAFGTFHFNGAFTKDDGRISSTIQYYNSLAVYLNAAMIIGAFLGRRAPENTGSGRILPVLFAIGNFVLFVIFLGTQSRGAWLLFPIIMVVYLCLLDRSWRLPVFASLSISIVSTLAVVGKVLDFSGGKSSGSYWLWLFIGMVLCGVLQYGFGCIHRRYQGQGPEIARRGLRIGAGVAALVLIAGVVLVLQKPEVLPSRLADRVKNINFQQHSVQERFYFYKDAIKIINDHPLLGTGGGGWEDLYRKYQSYLYDSTEVHNHFLQIWVETGIVGFLLFLAVWAAFLRELFRTRKLAGSGEEKSLLAAVGAACIALGLHAVIDFTLSVGAIMLLLWCLFGLITASHRLSSEDVGKPEGSWGSVPVWLSLVLAVIVIIGAASLEASMQHGSKAVAASKYNDTESMQKEFEAAHFYDPFKASYLTDMGNMQLNEGTTRLDSDIVKHALETENRAQKLDQGNPKIRQIRAKIYFTLDERDKGSADIEESLRLAPWKAEVYASAANLYFELGKFYYKEGKNKLAKEYFRKAVGVQETMNKQLTKLTPDMKFLWDVDSPMLGPSESMTDIINTSKAYIKEL